MRFSIRNASGSRGARLVVSGVLICCLGTACSNTSAPSRTDAHRSGTVTAGAASPSPSAQSTLTPAVTPSAEPAPTISADPASRDPARLAAGLDDAAGTLREGRATSAEVGRAAEFQQLALRNLAHSPAGFRRKVISRLDPRTAQTTRSQIRAALALATISDPRSSLPDWRIVAPAPPDELLRDYHEAQRRTGVGWTYLAAIQFIETRMGRVRGTSSAGAQGPMQFTRSTWQIYGAGGDINDDRDSILAAARLLKAYGGTRDMDAALWHYDPAEGYVHAVDAYAKTMQRSESAYYGYWHWQVIYSYQDKSFILPVGYPRKPAVRLAR